MQPRSRLRKFSPKNEDSTNGEAASRSQLPHQPPPLLCPLRLLRFSGLGRPYYGRDGAELAAGAADDDGEGDEDDDEDADAGGAPGPGPTESIMRKNASLAPCTVA